MLKQYKHILVPLDGSELAELAVDDAFSLAQLSQAEVTLLQVVYPAEEVIGAEAGYPIYLDQQWENQKILALEYLNDIRKRKAEAGLTANLAVEMGAPAETIINYASKHPIDLIVMATHGRSGFQRWVYGSVADKVLRHADVPVLLVRCYTEQKVTV
jgi:nucleotide-binding universal stress UspA family protein